MWVAIPNDEYSRRHKWYEKKRHRELKAVLDNVDTLFKALQNGARLQHMTFGFMRHREPGGVIGVDQRGGGGRGSLAETRLYVFVDEEAEELHLITLGDKGTQRDDIEYCKRFVKAIRDHNAQQQKAKDHDEDNDEASEYRVTG